jgi:hypothetical protein
VAGLGIKKIVTASLIEQSGCKQVKKVSYSQFAVNYRLKEKGNKRQNFTS